MFSLLLLAAVAIPLLTPGERLPVLQGEFLTGRTAVLPEAANGRIALLAMGFSYESRFAVEAWVGRFRNQFDGQPQVTFYEIPLIGGMGRMGKWFIDGGMRRGTPRAEHEHVITVYGGTEPWKQRTGYRSPGAAGLILLDQRGIVNWRYTGMFSEEAYGALARQTAGLLEAGSAR